MSSSSSVSSSYSFSSASTSAPESKDEVKVVDSGSVVGDDGKVVGDDGKVVCDDGKVVCDDGKVVGDGKAVGDESEVVYQLIESFWTDNQGPKDALSWKRRNRIYVKTPSKEFGRDVVTFQPSLVVKCAASECTNYVKSSMACGCGMVAYCSDTCRASDGIHAIYCSTKDIEYVPHEYGEMEKKDMRPCAKAEKRNEIYKKSVKEIYKKTGYRIRMQSEPYVKKAERQRRMMAMKRRETSERMSWEGLTTEQILARKKKECLERSERIKKIEAKRRAEGIALGVLRA